MKTYISKALVPLRNLGWLTIAVIAIGASSIIGLTSARETAAAVQTASEYCSQYNKTASDEDNRKINACKDGLNGTDCQNYVDAGFGQDIADICSKAASDLAAGIVSKGDVSVPETTPSPSPSPSTDSSSGADLAGLQNILDQTKSLSDYIDILHGAGEDKSTDTSKEADNNYGSYVNGAGKQQSIKVINPGSGSSPAILFFNGGGWHANDLAGENLAGIKTPLYDNTGAERAQDRGYAMFDVTYRLGSSGIYYMYEDVMRGIQHMRNNAGMYGIDPNKIVIWGDSAGGSLAMRAAASGKSGAKAAVGWSAPTNAYTALFKSIQSFGIGMDHSTCVPTDLAGLANFANLAAGGSGDVAQYGQGLSSNDVSSLGIDLGSGSFSSDNINPLSLLTEGMIAGKNVLSAGKDAESISSQIGIGNGSGSGGSNIDMSSLAGSAFNLASKKFIECIDNFNVMSPALFASPDSPPSFLAEFEDDGLIDPAQSYGMRDKLRQLGIKSDALILPGSDDCMRSAAAPAGAGGCHLGYYKDFVCKTLNFVDSIVQPERGETDCATGVAENASNSNSGGGAGGSNSVSSSNSGGGSNGSSNNTGSGGSPNNNGGSQKTCPADQPQNTLGGCGSVVGKCTHGCQAAPAPAPAPGKGTVYVPNTANASTINDAVAKGCPSGKFSNSYNSVSDPGMIVYVCQ